MKAFTENLIRKAATGNQDAIAELYELTYSSVYKTVKSMIADEDTVLDILQDSYIKGFQSLDQLDVPENFPAWIKRIATNKTKDYLKKKKPILFTDMAGDDGEEIDFRDDCLAHCPEEVLDRKETARLMQEILATLSEDQRLVIGMFYYEEMSVREIAEILECSENTVKSRLNYGRKKVEIKVKELEKRGIKLYSLAPLPFLLWLFRMDAEAAEIPSAAALSAITAQCAGNGVATGATVGAAAKAAAGAGAKALTTKIVAGVLAVAVVAGGGIAAVTSKDREEAEPTQQTVLHETDSSRGSVDRDELENTTSVIPEETVPTLTAEEAYQNVTADYQAVIGVDSTAFLSEPERYFNGDHAAIRYYHMYHAHSFYYAYYDIDKNGTDELLIGISFGQEVEPVDVYTLHGRQIIHIVDEPTLGDRSQLSILEDGTMYMVGSSGAAETSYHYWKLKDAMITEAEPSSAVAAKDIPWQFLAGKEPVSAESAYEVLLEEYRAACPVDHEEWQNNMTAYGELYSNLDNEILLSYHFFGVGKVFVAYHDIDGNGTSELFVGVGADAATAYPYAAYAFDGRETVQICSVLSEVLADGTILECGNGGGIVRILQISSDGFTLEDKTDTDIVQGSLVFDQDFSRHGGNVILMWEELC